jgi:hypothetical protein
MTLKPIVHEIRIQNQICLKYILTPPCQKCGHFTTDLAPGQAAVQFHHLSREASHFLQRQGVDWYHDHREFLRAITGTIGYVHLYV